MIVADTGNNRFVLFDKNHNFRGDLNISQKMSLNGPTDIFFDKKNSEFYVCSYNDNKVVCLR